MKRVSIIWRRWFLVLLLLAVVAITLITGQNLGGSVAVDGGDYGMVFLVLLYINLFLVLALGFIVFRNVFRLWLDRHRQRTGSKLRTRMVLMFVALSLLPTLVIAILSVNFLNRGVDSWFSERISQALENSLEVARAYYRENQRTVRHDAEAIVRNRQITAALSLEDADSAIEILEVERHARGLDEIAILRGDGTRLARAGELPFDPIPDLNALKEGSNKALMVTNDVGDRVRAFVRLGDDLYLSTGHWIDRQILGQMETIESVYVNYQKLRASHGLLKANHTVTLVLITLLLLFSAIWSGFRIADNITDPITELVIGTRKVANGDLSVTLSVSGEDELSTLMAAFNAMTQKLTENREELQSTNALLEERRQFMAAIVRNISSGVMSVNQFQEVTLMNPASGNLLGIDPIHAMGRALAQAIPKEILLPLQSLLANHDHGDRKRTVPQPLILADHLKNGIQIEVQGPEKPLTLLARVTPLEDSQGASRGFIATFDDITEILIAQRTSAWSEVARRIAHEIKNPLTPIQLWAQRMRRKYLNRPHDEPMDLKVLDEGTKTIINQVEELRVLVNEFSTFARLPRPKLLVHDILLPIREVLLLHAEELKGVTVETHFADDLPPFPHDPGQIKQVMSNLIANALASVRQNTDIARLAIAAFLAENGRWVHVHVADNGDGIDPANRTLVFEPYFTTKKRGTGLGLAIVKKIIEDHGGTIRLRESTWGGALVDICLSTLPPKPSQPDPRQLPENKIPRDQSLGEGGEPPSPRPPSTLFF